MSKPKLTQDNLDRVKRAIWKIMKKTWKETEYRLTINFVLEMVLEDREILGIYEESGAKIDKYQIKLIISEHIYTLIKCMDYDELKDLEMSPRESAVLLQKIKNRIRSMVDDIDPEMEGTRASEHYENEWSYENLILDDENTGRSFLVRMEIREDMSPTRY
jgi:hypothetical protein